MNQALLPLDPAPRRRDGNAEARAQAAVVEWVRWCAPQVTIFHVPNGGLRSKAEAARLRWVGTLSGVFDLILVLPEGRVAFWEVKAPGGRLSSEQREFIKRLDAAQHLWGIVYGIDDARTELARLGVKTREARA